MGAIIELWVSLGYLCSIRRGKELPRQLSFFFSLPTHSRLFVSYLEGLSAVWRRFTSTCIYAWERDFPIEILVYFILVFSYSKIIKLLGSNKSNYGSDYRLVSIPWILVLYKKRERIAEAVSFLLLVTHPPTPFC